MDMLKPKILVIDDLLKENDPLMVELNAVYDNVQLIKVASEVPRFISENIDKKMIVILDIKLSTSEPDGHQVLKEIRKLSNLIPVIIWSAVDEKSEEFSDFINNHAFAFISRPAKIEKIIEKVKEAEMWLDLQVASALEEWISLHPEAERDKPYIISKDGSKYSLNELLDGIRHRTPQGIQLEKQIIMLTIDLLARSKAELKKENE